MQGITITLEELLALRYKANQLHLPAQKMSANGQQGNYQSPYRGRGMDFLENRIYQPGDDTRNINWAVTARTGKPHTKIYQQERDRPVYFIIDFNSSMYFGTRQEFKSVLAAKVAALISWAAVKNGDRIGALLLKTKNQFLPHHRHKKNLIEFLKQLVHYVNPEDVGEINYLEAFRTLKTSIKSGSLIYFLSDFYSFNDIIKNELQALAYKHQVAAVFLYDPIEKSLPKNGRLLFHNGQNQESMLVDTHNHSLCEKYGNIFLDREQQVKSFCFKSGIQLAELSTTDDLLKVIRQILNKRV